MSVEYHHFPREAFTALAAGEGGPSAIRILSDASYSKLLLLMRGVLRSSAGHPQAGDVERGYELLTAIQEEAPAAVEAVLRHPPVRAWARHAIRALVRGSAAPDLGRLLAVTAAAAMRAGMSCTVTVPAPGGVLALPTLGCALLRSERAEIEVASGGAHISGLIDDARPSSPAGAVDRVWVPAGFTADLPGWRGLRRLSAVSAGIDVELLIDDVDPYRLPSMTNLTDPLTDHQIRDWQSVLDPAWDILVRNHTATAHEVRSALRVVTPLRSPEHGQVSATGRDTFGSIAMSAPVDPQSFAETLAHEVQHVKLTALLDLVQLSLPDDGSRYYAPWRDDPRPASGLLQGVYAYLGVTGFWHRERANGARGHADSAFARWRESARLGADTLLASGRLTAAGTEFVAGVRSRLLAWQEDSVPAEAMAQARRENDRHRADWRQRNGDMSP